MAGVQPKQILQQARELESKGETKEASLKYASLIPVLIHRKKYKEAIELTDKTLKLSPTSTRLHLTKALCLMGLKQMQEACVELEKFAFAGIRQGRLSLYFDLAKERLVGQPQLMKSYLESVLKIERMREDIFFQLSLTLSELGQNERSLEILLSGIKINEKSQEGRGILKELIEKRGNFEELEACQRWLNGEITLEQFRKKIISWAPALENPNDEPIRTFEAERVGTLSVLKTLDEDSVINLKKLIQDLEEELGERPKGIETIEAIVREFKDKALSCISDDPGSIIDLAVAFREMGLTRESKELLTKIPLEDEKYLLAQALLGELEIESGSMVGALDIYQGILRSSSLTQEIAKESLYNMARIYVQLGDFERAQESADKLVELDRHYRGINKLKQAIRTHKETKSHTKREIE